MNTAVDERYLTWLYSRAIPEDIRPRRLTYRSLIHQMYATEFVWIVPNDDNRIADGLELRSEFMAEMNLRELDSNWLGAGCSVLEMILGVSLRMSFEMSGAPSHWFWTILENLNLLGCHDIWYKRPSAEREVGEILHSLIWRTYNFDGSGGMFPLRYPDHDQRKVEIWYQMSSYILESL